MKKPFVVMYRIGVIKRGAKDNLKHLVRGPWRKWSSYKTERAREDAINGLNKSYSHIGFEFAKKEEVCPN